MYTLHCTKKPLDRFKSVLVDPVYSTGGQPRPDGHHGLGEFCNVRRKCVSRLPVLTWTSAQFTHE
jgi:hypothetical protein